MAKSQQQQGRSDRQGGVKWPHKVKCVVGHVNPDPEFGLMVALLHEERLTAGRFRFAGPVEGIETKFISSGPLKPPEWLGIVPDWAWEGSSGDQIQGRLEEKGYLFLDCGQPCGPFNQHGWEDAQDRCSLDRLLEFLDWNSAGQFGHLAVLFRLIAANDLEGGDLSGVKERIRSRAVGCPPHTIRSLAKALGWWETVTSDSQLEWLVLGFLAVMAELAAEHSVLPAGEEVVKNLLSEKGLVDVAEKHLDPEVAGWFAEIAGQSGGFVDYEWGHALEQAADPKICRLQQIEVPREFRSCGFLDLAVIDSGAVQEGDYLSPLIDRAVRYGNTVSGCAAEMVAPGTRMYGAGEIIEVLIDRNGRGAVKITWLDLDDQEITETFGLKDRIKLGRPFPDQLERRKANLVLVYRSEGDGTAKFSLAEAGRKLANTGIMAEIAEAIRMADLEDRYYVVRTLKGRGRSTMRIDDRALRAKLARELGGSKAFSVVKDRGDRMACLDLVTAEGVSIERGIREIQKHGSDRKVIFMDLECRMQLRQPGLNLIRVQGLDESGRLSWGWVEVIYFAEWEGLIGNGLISNPTAKPTTLSLARVVGLVKPAIRRAIPAALEWLEVRHSGSKEPAHVGRTGQRNQRGSRRPSSDRPDRRKKGHPARPRRQNRQSHSGSRPDGSGSSRRPQNGGRKSTCRSSTDGGATTSLGQVLDAAHLLGQLLDELPQEKGK